MLRAQPRRPIKRAALTWEDAVDRYELHLRAQRVAALTLESHVNAVNHLRAHFAAQPACPSPAEVTLAELRLYQAGLYTGETSASGKPLSTSSVSHASSCLRRFFAYLDDERLIPEDPARRLERPRTPIRHVGDVLTVPEVTRLLAAADPGSLRGLRDRTIVELLYSTGLRRGELLNLDLQDVDHEQREVRVRCGKGGKARILPLTRAAWAFLERYLAEARPLLVRDHPDSSAALFLSVRGRRHDEMALVHLLRRLAKAARISKRVTGHTMRRSFATHLLQSGASLRHIQLLLGHSDLTTTSLYLRLDTQDIRREVLLKHPRERMNP
jgi:integrase/recombinase XerD